jgi:hypothetical protein
MLGNTGRLWITLSKAILVLLLEHIFLPSPHDVLLSAHDTKPSDNGERASIFITEYGKPQHDIDQRYEDTMKRALTPYISENRQTRTPRLTKH